MEQEPSVRNSVGETRALPCPFCGSEPTVIDRRGGYLAMVECGCEKASVEAGTLAEAIASWNTRALVPPPAASEPSEEDARALQTLSDLREWLRNGNAYMEHPDGQDGTDAAIDALDWLDKRCRQVLAVERLPSSAPQEDSRRLDALQELVRYRSNVGPDHEADATFDAEGYLECRLMETEGDLRKAIDLLSEERPS